MKTLNWKRSGLLLGVLALGMGSVSLPVVGERVVTVAYAQEGETDQVLINTLFGTDTTPEEFATALEQAKAAKLSPQTLLEAQMARALFAQDISQLLAFKQAFTDAGANYDFKESRLFLNRASYDSMNQGLLALEARDKADAAAFEKHIKEALWLAPTPLQMMYLQWLNDYRVEQAMSKIVVPLKQKLATAEGAQATLEETLGKNKAVLLDFWASWCTPCMQAMDGLNEKSAKLAAQGVVLAGINDGETADVAANIKKQKQLTLPWLIDSRDEPYSALFQIETLPRAVLVSPEGKVLYNGHPEDPALKTALKKIGVTL